MALTWLSKSVQEALTPKKTIIDVLKSNLGGWKPARSHLTTHASDITKEGFCPRQTCLLILTGKDKKDEYINTALQATFDVGNATGDIVVERWAGDSMVGNWECRKCLHRATFVHKPSMACKTGGRCDFRYEEVRFHDKEFDVSGSLDALFDLGSSKLHVTELKIINVSDFEKIVAPLAEHRIRTSMYLKIIENSKSPYRNKINLKTAKVLYVSRGFGKKHPSYNEILPFKEFDIERNDESVEPYLAKAKLIKVYKETGAMPPRLCKSETDKLAKKCAVCTECFAHKDKTYGIKNPT